MFIHNFKYALKTLFKDKMLIFWTFAFPIILGTFFNMAFSNIEKSEKLDIIDIAIVENEEFKENEIFRKSFKVLSDAENKDRIFNTEYTTVEEAEKLLEAGEISGYLLLEETPKVVVSTSGINETVLKYVTEEILQTEEIMKNISENKIEGYLEKNPSLANDINSLYTKVYIEVMNLVEKSNANIENVSSNNLSYTMIEFYTLIAMTCLYGGILGMTSINQKLANMSNNGKRVSVSPVSKGKIIFSSVLASFTTQLIGVALLFIYTIFVLNVDYGTNLPLIILLTFVGSLSGLSLGIMIATVLKANENTKTGVIISVTMLGCFLSGMMGITMKYVVDKNIPILNKLNPASMITDGFYSLYYYDTFNRFYLNVVSLLAFAFIMIAISVFFLRRQKYDSL